MTPLPALKYCMAHPLSEVYGVSLEDLGGMTTVPYILQVRRVILSAAWTSRR